MEKMPSIQEIVDTGDIGSSTQVRTGRKGFCTGKHQTYKFLQVLDQSIFDEVEKARETNFRRLANKY